MVALAALESGVITPDTPITCPGYFELGNATFHCWKHGGHGTLRLRDAIKNSCDVFFYETARRLGIDRIAAMAQRFGFGESLGIDIPGERAGLIPTATGSWRQPESPGSRARRSAPASARATVRRRRCSSRRWRRAWSPGARSCRVWCATRA